MSKAKKTAIPNNGRYTDMGLLLADVKDYLTRNYEFDGYDIVIETMEDGEVAKMIEGTKTMLGAMIAIHQKSGCKMLASVRKDVQAA